MQGRVTLDAPPVEVGPQGDQILGDLEVALEAGDHQAGVAVAVGYLDVWRKGNFSMNKRK